MEQSSVNIREVQNDDTCLLCKRPCSKNENFYYGMCLLCDELTTEAWIAKMQSRRKRS